VFTPPEDLADAEVAAALIWGWDLDVEGIEHAPVGFVSHHWWVRDASGRRWFATADDLRTRRRHHDEPLDAPFARLRAALATAASLHGAGLRWVVAPVRSDDGSVVLRLHESFALALHPGVEGETFGWGLYEDAAHRDAVVDRLVELHAMEGCRDDVMEDDLTVPLADELRTHLDDPGPRWGAGPFAADAWEMVRDHADTVRALLDRYDALVAGADRTRFVLTHGEPHRGNTMVTPDDGVVLVDWDTVLLAPPERDLWRVVGEDPAIRGRYEGRTGVALDDALLEAHALRWDLADVAVYVRDLHAPHVDDEDTRTAWAGLRAAVTATR
jgi:spectinomycin phosphotransferase/16S rRNA (guanine(1405)-N(7))-methyltransferase